MRCAKEFRISTQVSIRTVLDRIYSFSITSPIARFLTGLEILLSKCHEWEENAHVGVSLAEYSEKITHQIINWRKLELSYWKDSLNKAQERVRKSIIKWWFHLYSTIQQFLEDTNEQISVPRVIETLKQFIETSSLGEFEDRLNLLFVFHCHVVHMPKNSRAVTIISILWNLHSYYKQFLNNVITKIKDLRAPIEKKLRDFVKIARWNDINYWSIKETVEKTHRTLHKHIKEFEIVLKESVKVCLNHFSGLENPMESVGIWDRPQRHNPSKHHYTLQPSNYLATPKNKKVLEGTILESAKNSPLLERSEKFFSKSRNLCRDIISNTKYPNLIKNLDSFVADVIETSSNLKNLEVNKDLPKPKQKSQAKNILQQKRKALADLFKTLTTLGVSYRIGLIESKLQENSYTELLLQPVDLKASFEQMKIKSACTLQLLNVWDGCETYFLRTISRFAALQVALKQPSGDLGLQNIERCKGFAAHLTILGEEQKKRLINTSRDLFYLKHCSTNLLEWNQESTCLQKKTVDAIQELVTNVQIVMKQFKILLQSCPEQPNFASDQKEIPLLDSAVPNLIQYKYDSNWNNTLSELKSITSVAQKIKTYLDKHQQVLPNAEDLIETPNLIWFNDLSLMKTNFETMSTKIKTIKSNFGICSGIVESLNYLLEQTEDLGNDLEAEESIGTDEECLENFGMQVEKLTETILLVVQNMFKKYKQLETIENEEKNGGQKEKVEEKEKETGQKGEGENEDDQIDQDFIENHLRVAVIQNLFDDLSNLQTDKVLSKVFEVMNSLNKMNASETKLGYQILSNSLPLLEQIVLIYEYFITQQVASYRVTCKLNSILLNIFTELATNGFCVPPEFSDEFGPEGQQKPQNGMGLGDGEGEGDVSDRIENEDQLDDAQPAGQEKKKEEDKDCKEEDKGIEMSEDFDSKLQDINQPEEGEDQQSDKDDDDADKQMGETDPNSDKLDEQIWGSDDEEPQDEQKDTKEERGDGGEVEDQKMAAKEDNSNQNEEEENDPNSKDKKKDQEKDINEMDDQEIDDDQIDPYHGNHPQMPEPEDLDLPDDLKLEDGEEKDEAQEENPFDIDTMKEQMPNIAEEPKPEEKEGDKEEKKHQEDSSDEEEDDTSQLKDKQMDTDNPEDDQNPEEPKEDEKTSSNIKKAEDKIDEEEKDPTKEEESGLDPEPSSEDQIQPMDIDNTDNSDNFQTNPNQKSTEQSDQVSQEESLDKDGVGQSQMEESESGHKGTANANKQSSNKQKEIDDKQKRQRPGEADSNRSLGETNEPVKKKMKTVNIQDVEEQEEDEGVEQGKDADMYQHIKEAKEADTQVLDAATKEQAETQKIQELDDDKINEDDMEMATDEPEPEITDVPNQKPEKTDNDKKKPDKKQTEGTNGEIIDEMRDVEIEGEIVETMNVERGTDSSYHTQYNIASEKIVARLSSSQIVDLRNELENQLASWNEPPPSIEAEKIWEKFSAVTSSLARDLSEQLRLVLEPTQASRLRGDFKTGRRINMRKVIPYIASQFRKDKIWLRRTKPSKREYQIVLAIDDSSSMDDNHSNELAFESVALISKALSLLESGQLSILSFGEQTDILHKLSDTFTEKTGVKLLQKFTFQQKKTCVANLVDFVTNMFSAVHTTAVNAKLLVIVSDGRGIFSEGETVIQQAIRRAKFADIFMVFVILDNPENKNSILDIRMPVFKDGKLLGIKSYLDSFPFPFYIILRDISNLPNVLSDALRQWFELVTNKDS